ncbi:MAG: hypothetical protein AAGK00_19760 [Pseudomonadota bacterium]
MANYWRSGDGRKYLETAARWVVEQAAMRGLSVHDYLEGRCTLADLGVTTENAMQTLMPRMPDAHHHYLEHRPRGKGFATWAEWFSHRLRNRIFYFFHRHRQGGGLTRCFAEWPIEVPQRPKEWAA